VDQQISPKPEELDARERILVLGGGIAGQERYLAKAIAWWYATSSRHDLTSAGRRVYRANRTPLKPYAIKEAARICQTSR